jgi:hydrogenase maturation protease
MAACITNECRMRLLGLGNEILADDAFGILVAQEARRTFDGQLDVVCSAASGFHLLDDLLGAPHLVVVDTIVTGTAQPGTIHVLRADQFTNVPGGSPHSVGLFEVMAAARQLNLAVPREMTIIAVEAADCTTVGGGMHPDVRAAARAVVELIGHLLREVEHA